ncbi:MAG: nickel-dependent hydrogenase large subunit, partial [Sulfolobales archaeon]
MFDSIVQDISELSSRDLELQPATTRGASAGLGVVEAPRGLLIHYYEVDKDLKVVKADIATPTVMNTEHVELSATSIAKELLAEGASDPTIQKYVEALVRAYDPCIPCAVHVVKVR